MHIQPSSPNSSEDDAATKIQAGFRGYRVRKQLQRSNQSRAAKENESTNGLQNGSVLEEKSATKIQAGIRGFLVRKRQKVEKDAAVKIQASFRGFKTRRELLSTSNKKTKINWRTLLWHSSYTNEKKN